MGKAASSTDASDRHQFVEMAFVLLTKYVIMVFVKIDQTKIKISIQTIIQITIQIIIKIIIKTTIKITKIKVGDTLRAIPDTVTLTLVAILVPSVSTINALVTTKIKRGWSLATIIRSAPLDLDAKTLYVCAAIAFDIIYIFYLSILLNI